jgi:hypothetical protein
MWRTSSPTWIRRWRMRRTMLPSPPLPPLPRSGRGGDAGRTAVHPYTPLPRSGRGAGGEGEKSASVPIRSELKCCTLIRGEGRGEGGFESCAFTNFGSAVGIIPIACPKFMNCPPSCRFPPLREGNRARVRFPLLAGGTLGRGFSFIRTFVNSGSAISITSEKLELSILLRVKSSYNNKRIA